MNYLAHTLLAGGDVELEIGGILGDFVRGRPDPAWSRGLREGIALHRAVDSYTDAHPAVLAAKRLFEPPWRRYAGILLDVWFDHCLARDFAHWSEQPLEGFSRHLRASLEARAQVLPPGLRRFAAYMQAHDLPAAYRDEAMIGQVLRGIGTRLKRANPLDRALPELQAKKQALEACFHVFYPDLTAHAERWRAARPGRRITS